MQIEETDKYQYLGEIINNKGKPRGSHKEARTKNRSSVSHDAPHSKRQKLQRNKYGSNLEISGNMHYPIIKYGAEGRIKAQKENQKIQTIINNIIYHMTRSYRNSW